MEPLLELKPNRTAFVLYRFIKEMAVPFFIAVVLSLVSLGFSWIGLPIIGLLFILIFIYKAISLWIQYKKQLYTFYDNRAIVKGGGIFTDHSTELVMRNITHVKLIKPFIENKLFGTGNVLIELAGSASVEGFLVSVEKPDEIYALVAERMRKNGFKLSKKELVQKEKPSTLGVIFETLAMLGGSVFLFIYLIASFGDLAFALISNPLIILPIIGIAALFILLKIGIRFMDLLMRVYYIYSDTIVYEEGFLTKVYAFMPVENLADSTITQTLVDKIFGLYDVKVSCQGAAQEIDFKNISHGPEMEKNIDELINKTETLLVKGTGKEKPEAKIAPAKTEKLSMETPYTKKMEMDLFRSMAWVLLLIILEVLALVFGFLMGFVFPPLGTMMIMGVFFYGGFFIVTLFIGTLVSVFATRYRINPRSMAESFNFLRRRDVEFSNDKITGIILIKSIIDDFFNTITIRFWSIGSGQDINFKNIKDSEELRQGTLKKFGFAGGEKIYETASQFSILEMLKAHLGLSLLGIVAIPAMLVFSVILPALVIVPILLLAAIALFVIYRYFYYRTSKLYFTKDYVHFRAGIFVKKYYYASYDNIKDIQTVLYPFSSIGAITFNVAGEGGMTMEQGHQQKKAMPISHHFKVNYVPGIKTKDELIDLIFYKRPSADELSKIEANIGAYIEKNIAATRQALPNSLLSLLLVLTVVNLVIAIIFYLTLIVSLPLSAVAIVWTILTVKSRRYFIQPYRVVAKWGIFYKNQTSIIFTRIDHLRSFQGITNKIFKNGKITVHTIGSRKPEIVILDIADYNKFYQSLEKYY